ncbi:MAG: hypothetical protein A2017_06530 [Lentisphaerae bacterium GWF2_44_16]|nr:MAG: hypothetical protein A2017_06530 [Lentisphaerae bacterium GWF2_44_16]
MELTRTKSLKKAMRLTGEINSKRPFENFASVEKNGQYWDITIYHKAEFSILTREILAGKHQFKPYPQSHLLKRAF